MLNISSPLEMPGILSSDTEMSYKIINNSILIYINKPHSSKISSFPYIYSYSILPKRSGKFQTTSIMRSSSYTAGTIKINPDLKTTLNLDILPPDPNFEVSIKYPDNLEAYVGDALDLSYIITYKGGYTNPAIYKLILDNDTEGLLIKRNRSFNETFMINKPILISCPIKCIRDGTYFLPSLWIGEMYYPIDQTITIVSFLNKYKDDLYNLISLILQLLALGIPIGFIVRRELKKIYFEVRSMSRSMEASQKERHCCIDKENQKDYKL